MEHLKNYKQNEGAGLQGIVTITTLVPVIEEAREIDALLSTASCMQKKDYNYYTARLREICESKQVVLKNRVVLTGRAVFARLAVGDNTFSGAINFGSLGTSSAVIADGNTQLTTEVFRKGIASRSRSGSSFTIDFYYSKNDTNGTYNEFGMFTNGTATANSGQLFNRVLTGGWSKTSSEAMTVSVQIDFNAV